MAANDSWYLIGPLLAAGVVALLGAFLQYALRRDPDRPLETCPGGLGILNGTDGDDYGLLRPAALTDDPWLADDIRRLLGDAGIRATHGVRLDGRVVVLVFAEEIDEARRLVGDSPLL
jgi:hypothetical protein